MKKRLILRTGEPQEYFGNLQIADMQKCLNRLPTEVYELLKRYPNELILAGGFIRSTLADERIRDIDLFISKNRKAQIISKTFKEIVLTTENSYSIKLQKVPQIQICFCWKFTSPKELLNSFDFSICKAAIYHNGNEFLSICSSFFYPDINNKILRPLAKQKVDVKTFQKSIVRSAKFFELGYRPTTEMELLAMS